MTLSRIAPQALVHLAATEISHSATPSLRSRVRARVFAARLDRAVDECEVVRPGSALAVHIARLTSAAEREHLAAALRSRARSGRRHTPGGSTRLGVDRANVHAATELIDTVVMALDAPVPVRPRGVARVRLLLADGAGPLYTTGSGSLAAALQGVLAAL